MKFPANCLIVAAICGRTRMRTMRNRAGRLHFFWRDADGRAWEFYTKGASRRSYVRNSFTCGEIARMPSMDRSAIERAIVDTVRRGIADRALDVRPSVGA